MRIKERNKNKEEIIIPIKFGKFLCIFESNNPDPGFTVTSPAAPGFVTYGRTLEEAKKMAREGLEFHCECEFLEHIGGGASYHLSQRVAR